MNRNHFRWLRNALWSWFIGILGLSLLLGLVWPWPLAASQRPSSTEPAGFLASRSAPPRQHHTTIEPFVRPSLAPRMAQLRPVILAAAQRHNRPAISGMDDHEFAAVIALIIYNENFGWLEDDLPPLRLLTPLYQDLQRQANQRFPGSNFSVWPANLRPSVGREILRRELPLSGARTITVPITVAGSTIDPAAFASEPALLAAINREISRDDLAVAYLAANLERGLYRAAYEGVTVNWRTLAAWHNQGLVAPRQFYANPTTRDYLRRARAYLPLAEALIAEPGPVLPAVSSAPLRPGLRK
ncbi:MAG: hypothetical protein AB4911_09295 [Oscillochloridaceae bacterium umkhey_bin13]